MTTASDLLGLQEIDLQRDKNRAQIADIDARLVETEELIEAREAAAAAETELADLRRRQRAIETELKDLDAKIRPLEEKLYGGSIRNPKELSDLQREVELLKAQRSKIEDEGLAGVDAVETAEATLATARQSAATIEADWRADQEGLRVNKARIEGESALLDAERARQAANLDPLSLGQYEKLRSVRQGRAVAHIERGTCGGCRISLPTHIVQRARGGSELVPCPSCERILVP
jgi:uncharacterized protein